LLKVGLMSVTYLNSSSKSHNSFYVFSCELNTAGYVVNSANQQRSALLQVKLLNFVLLKLLVVSYKKSGLILIQLLIYNAFALLQTKYHAAIIKAKRSFRASSVSSNPHKL
jgi:hypothetical protein